MILLLILLPAFLYAEYIVYDPIDKVEKDYGTKDNYIKALEEWKLDSYTVETNLQSAVKHYSNAYVSMSNASALQEERKTTSWWKTFAVGSGCFLGGFVAGVISMIFGSAR